MKVPEVVPPSTRDELLGAFARLHEDSGAYWRAFDDVAFFRPLGQGWSPADNVRHLSKSIRPVARALGLPRLLLLLRFGRPKQARPYERICADYDALLAAGATAGRFTPSPLGPDGDPAARRVSIMAAREQAAAALSNGIARWTNEQLDHRRLPHPLLGKLSVREMLFFTLYHNLHHVQVAERRRREAT